MNDLPGFYNVAMHPGQISIYYESNTPRRPVMKPWIDPYENGGIDNRIPIQFKDNAHHGIISKVAARKITRAIDYLVYLVPKKSYYHPGHGRAGNYYLNFITLTLSSEQIHTDNEINRLMLQPFLVEIRHKFKVVNYIWRAEKQENGAIHYHLITDRFIWWNDLRNCWNYYQQKLGYVARYRDNQRLWHQEGFKFRPEFAARWPLASQLHAYQDGIRHDWNSPNTTDVHSLKTITSVRSYLRKYITKSDQSQDIEGHLWGCSDGLKNLHGARSFAAGQISDELNILYGSTQAQTYKSDYYTVIFCDFKLLHQLHLTELVQLFEDYITITFPCYRPPGLPFKLAA